MFTRKPSYVSHSAVAIKDSLPGSSFKRLSFSLGIAAEIISPIQFIRVNLGWLDLPE